MSTDIKFPLELVIKGVPLSLGASSGSRQRWQARLASVARQELQEGYWLTSARVAATIFYFPDAAMEGDIDNIVKPILDAFNKVVYFDDRQVGRLLVQNFEPGRTFTFEQPTPRLLECAAMHGPRTYIRCDDETSLGVL